MYINTFKYTPKDVSCQLCTEYVKKLGCTALRCPWLAERIEAGVVGYCVMFSKGNDCSLNISHKICNRYTYRNAAYT